MSTEVISSAIQERTAMTVAGDRSTGNFGHRHGLCIKRLQFNPTDLYHWTAEHWLWLYMQEFNYSPILRKLFS